MFWVAFVKHLKYGRGLCTALNRLCTFVPFAYYLITIYGCDHYNAISWISSSSHSFTINNYLTGIRMTVFGALGIPCIANFHLQTITRHGDRITSNPNTPPTKTSSWRNLVLLWLCVNSFIFMQSSNFQTHTFWVILSHLVIKCNAKDHLKQLWFIVLSFPI